MAERTVSNYMVRPRKPRTQTWRTFLNNHSLDVVHIDILKAHNSTVRQLYDFPILRHIRRLFSCIRLAMAHRTAKPAFVEGLCLLVGDGDGTATCHNQQRSRGSRVDEHPRGSNEPACLWLHRESTTVRKRGPTRQDDRIIMSADSGMHRTYARAA